MAWLFGRGRKKEDAAIAPQGDAVPAAAVDSGPPPRDFPTQIRCGWRGCDARSGYQCPYVDARNRHCSAWCAEHSTLVNGQRWCVRHANTVRWLSIHEGSLLKVQTVADLDDRSPNLVGMLVDDLDSDVKDLLARVSAQLPHTQVVTDKGVRDLYLSHRLPALAGAAEPTPGRIRVWERGWGVHAAEGYVVRVVLRATATEPPECQLVINGTLVFKSVPDWIARRAAGEEDRALRQAFRSKLLAAISTNVKLPGSTSPTW